MAKIALSKKKETNNKASFPNAGEQKEIQRLAYQFFVERGYQHGFDREDWARAEAIVRNKRLS